MQNATPGSGGTGGGVVGMGDGVGVSGCEGGGCVLGGFSDETGVSVAAGGGASPVIFILHSCVCATTLSPSGTSSSAMIPATGESTGMAVWSVCAWEVRVVVYLDHTQHTVHG